MKKRCTNSSCRRIFRPVTAAGKGYECPYCGKHYGAAETFAGYRLYQDSQVCLADRIGLIKALVHSLNLSLHEASGLAGKIRRPEGAVCLMSREQQAQILEELRERGVRSVRVKRAYEK